MFKRPSEQECGTRYAAAADFCRILRRDMNEFYLLGLLLTADRELAEVCFVQSLESAVNSPPVFKEWAKPWLCRMMIQKAIRLCFACEPPAGPTPNSKAGDLFANREGIGVVLSLPVFERFVFVMAMLKRYSDQECSLLLGCSRREVRLARIRAFEQIGNANRSDLHQPNADKVEDLRAEDTTSFVSSGGT